MTQAQTPKVCGHCGEHTNYTTLKAALQQAVEVIKQWHNMDGSHDVWQIYYENAPEMKPIRDALSAEQS